jgi:flagellar biosynthesis anti-sigma factor FlgM
MKVENNGSHSISQSSVSGARSLEGTRGVSNAGNASATAQADQLSLSEDAKLLSKALTELKQNEEVRADKVAELKASYEAGSYSIPYAVLAKRLKSLME